MHRLRPPAAIAAGALALWLTLPAYVNYDTAWSLVWGGELAHGAAPRLDAPWAPTPHPLGTALGMLLAPLGAAAGDATTLLVLGALVAVIWLVLALARAWFGGTAGWIAAALALTSVPLLTAAGRSYLDVPYLALVLGALLVETRRPRAGAPVLALLAVAGLWRPEAWLFSVAYWVWAAYGRSRAQAARLAALAVAAPALWALGDLALAGDPLHSLTWTREQAAALGRARGPGALRQALPDKLAHAAGLPVLVAGTAGLALALHRGRGLAATALGASLATAAALTAAGMPVVERYLLLPALLLAVLAAGAAWAAWGVARELLAGASGAASASDSATSGVSASATSGVSASASNGVSASAGATSGVSASASNGASASASASDGASASASASDGASASASAGARYQGIRHRAAPAVAAGLGLLALLALGVPGRLGAVARQRDNLADQAALRADLRALADRGGFPARCAHIAASNHKLIPLLALWTGRAPANFSPGPAEAYVAPGSAVAQRTLLLASSDPPDAAPGPPAGALEVARNQSWRVDARC